MRQRCLPDASCCLKLSRATWGQPASQKTPSDLSGLQPLLPPPPPAPYTGSEARRHKRKANPMPLGLAAEVPELRRRPFICAYYRLEPPKWRHLWCCHNETGNMWTHIIAAALTLIRCMLWVRTWEVETGRLWYSFAVLAFFVGSLMTFCISAQYHWRLCSTDEEEFLCWMCLDQSSCLALVMLGFFAGVPMGYHCFPRLQQFYIVTSLLVCISMITAIMKIPKERWKLIAAVIIGGTGIGYVTPAVHWLVISEKGRSVIGSKFSAQIVMTGVAVIFYTRYIPERFAPGKFDLLGNSHQLWHVAIYMSIALYSECLIQVNALIASGTFCT